MLSVNLFGHLASTLIANRALRTFIVRSHRYNILCSARRQLATKESDRKRINIAGSCLNRLQTILENPKQEYLRVNIETGGCSGFSYVFDIEHEHNIDSQEDLVFKEGDYRVVVNKDMLPFLEGSTIEFHESLIKSSFQVVNPIAETKCSCGSSFSVNFNRLQQSSDERKKSSE